MSSWLVRLASRVPLLGKVADAVAPNRSAASATRRNTQEAYEAVYDSDHLLAEYLSADRLGFYDELVDILAPLAPRRVIDIGCGTGDLLHQLVARVASPPERVVGIDHAEAGIRRARERYPAGTWIVGDIYEWAGEDEQFDLVLCIEVLEHLARPEVVVARLCRLCAPDGRVAISVPDGDLDSWDGHVNFWSERALADFLAPYELQRIDRVDSGRTLLAWLAPAN